jgi:hypothetical protein
MMLSVSDVNTPQRQTARTRCTVNREFTECQCHLPTKNDVTLPAEWHDVATPVPRGGDMQNVGTVDHSP